MEVHLREIKEMEPKDKFILVQDFLKYMHLQVLQMCKVHIFGKKHAFQISMCQDILFIAAFMKFFNCLNSGILSGIQWCVCVCVYSYCGFFLNGGIKSTFLLTSFGTLDISV